MKWLAIVAALCSAACARDSDQAPAEHKASEVAATVEPVTTATFEESVDAVGVVSARPGHVAVLAAPAPTRVAKVFVSAGSPVKAGDPLIAFEEAPFEAAAQSAEAALVGAERAQARAARLADAGVLPRKEADAAATELANARVAAVTARRSRELAVLKAPIDGVVTRMNAALGASVDPSAALVEVTDPRALDVLLAVSPSDAARTKTGQAVALYPGASAAGVPVGIGRVAEVAGVVDSTSGGVSIRVTIVSSVRPIRVAETVFGRIAVAIHPGAVVVPLDALVPTGEGFRVFTVDAGGIAHATDVTLGARSDQKAWVTEGLKAGDRIVTKGAYGVDDSSKVVPGKP